MGQSDENIFKIRKDKSMKKLIAIVLTICLMATMLCAAVSGEDMISSPALDLPTGNQTDAPKTEAPVKNEPAREIPTDGTVLRISALKSDGTTVKIGDHKVFEDGWNAAVSLAATSSEMKGKGYDRIVVDLYADWNAVNGQFTKASDNSAGFDWDAIYFRKNVKMTLNLGGHTINRGLTRSEANGEVICIDDGADVIIKDGTITGGWSDNGAGGIHIEDGAKVVLENVHVDGNAVSDDTGAGISVSDGATLVMNGGSISDNRLVMVSGFYDNISCGGLYVNDATATLNKVTLSRNRGHYETEGVAIYADDGTVTMNECTVSDNAVLGKNVSDVKSVVAAYGSKLVIMNTDFTGNASCGEGCGNDNTLLFYLEDSRMTMNGGKVTGNNANELFEIEDSDADFFRVTITDNGSRVVYVNNDTHKVNMIECTIGNNEPNIDKAEIRVAVMGTLKIADCKYGDTTFNERRLVEFANGVNGRAMSASMLGDGSFAVIISFVALLASAASFTANAASGRRRGVKADRDE